MTIADAQAAVEAIRRLDAIHDDYSAHVFEVGLWKHVLREIAEGSADSTELARIALTTDEIDFLRW